MSPLHKVKAFCVLVGMGVQSQCREGYTGVMRCFKVQEIPSDSEFVKTRNKLSLAAKKKTKKKPLDEKFGDRSKASLVDNMHYEMKKPLKKRIGQFSGPVAEKIADNVWRIYPNRSQKKKTSTKK